MSKLVCRLFCFSRPKATNLRSADTAYCFRYVSGNSVLWLIRFKVNRRHWPQWVLGYPPCQGYDSGGQFCGIVATWLGGSTQVAAIALVAANATMEMATMRLGYISECIKLKTMCRQVVAIK